LTRSLAIDLAPVRVNCVSPGVIDTPIRAAMPETARRDMLAKAAAALPVGRVGAGHDIAQQILTFMTVGFATGSIVYLDGGGILVGPAAPPSRPARRVIFHHLRSNATIMKIVRGREDAMTGPPRGGWS